MSGGGQYANMQFPNSGQQTMYGSQGMPQQQTQQQQPRMSWQQGPQQPQNQYGWAPPAAQSTQTPQNYTAQYPQLYGGLWNQLSQQMAGPQYTPTPATQTATGAASQQPYGGYGGGFGGYGGIGMFR